MREAQLTLDILLEPSAHGAADRHVLRSGRPVGWAIEQICQQFGGCTWYCTKGCWIDSRGVAVHDNSITFRIAMEGEAANWHKLQMMAQRLADGQETVYLIAPGGTAYIMEVVTGAAKLFGRLIEGEAVVIQPVPPGLGGLARPDWDE